MTALAPEQQRLLRAISTYNGADRTHAGTPEHTIALQLEELGLIKWVCDSCDDEGSVAVWKMSGLGLDMLDRGPQRLPG